MKPFEFGASTAALAVDAHTSLGKIAKQLQANPGLRLHIAGHAQSDEDPKLSSQRAQAVGAALIALGAAPARLRAKGYGETVPLSSQLRTKLRIKSERRVGVHAIGEVATAFALEFESQTSGVGEQAGVTCRYIRYIRYVCYVRYIRSVRAGWQGARGRRTDARGEGQAAPLRRRPRR